MSPKERDSVVHVVWGYQRKKNMRTSLWMFSHVLNHIHQKHRNLYLSWGEETSHAIFKARQLFFEGTVRSMKYGRLRKDKIWLFKVLAQLTAQQGSLFRYVWCTGSVYTFANWKTHQGVKSGRQETGDILSPGSLMKSISFPMAAVSNRMFRACLDGAIQEVVMLYSRVIKLCYYCILSQLIILLISYSELCTGMGGLFLVSKLAQGSSHRAGSFRRQALIFIFQ